VEEYKMVKQKEETVITQLRIPKHLHHKIAKLSESDDRSFNSYIIKILQESVAEFEQNLLDSFGIIEFTELYSKMFGSDYLPYVKHEDVEFESEQIKIIAQKIMRGAPRSTGRAAGIRKIVPKQEYLKEREQRESESVADDNNVNDKSDNS
jgi:hypothetical protein